MAKRKSKKFYAIKSIDQEEVNKIVTTWDECKAIVDHHKAVYKGFSTKEEATDYLNNMNKDKQEECIKQMEYVREKKKVRKQTTQPLNVRIPTEIYNQFIDKITMMRYDKEEVIIDLIKDYIGMEE